MFCGLMGHSWHFIKGFTHIARPLYNVLGKEVKMGGGENSEEQDTDGPMLVFPDFDKPFLLETDASKEGLGAVLSQKQDDRC